MNIKELYKQGINIQKYFREQKGVQENDTESILYSYDYQAGSYTQGYLDEKATKYKCLLDGEEKYMTEQEKVAMRSLCIWEELNVLNVKTVLEVGVGEATNLADIVLASKGKISYSGLELSLSRLFYAKKFADYKQVTIDFVCGNMFSLPYEDNSFDAILLIHCLESNTGREKEALEELLRVARKYVILLEPSFELGNEETKKHISEYCYIQNLQATIKGLKLDVIKNELFRISDYNNNTGLTIIKKKNQDPSPGGGYACPKCKMKLNRYKEACFCPECFSLYPIYHGIPVLNPDCAVFCSKYEQEELFC